MARIACGLVLVQIIRLNLTSMYKKYMYIVYTHAHMHFHMHKHMPIHMHTHHAQITCTDLRTYVSSVLVRLTRLMSIHMEYWLL